MAVYKLCKNKTTQNKSKYTNLGKKTKNKKQKKTNNNTED